MISEETISKIVENSKSQGLSACVGAMAVKYHCDKAVEMQKGGVSDAEMTRVLSTEMIISDSISFAHREFEEEFKKRQDSSKIRRALPEFFLNVFASIVASLLVLIVASIIFIGSIDGVTNSIIDNLIEREIIPDNG